MQLGQQESALIHPLSDDLQILVDEDPHWRHKGRESGDNVGSRLGADRARAFCIQHKPDCIGASLHRRHRVIQIRVAADLHFHHNPRIVRGRADQLQTMNGKRFICLDAHR